LVLSPFFLASVTSSTDLLISFPLGRPVIPSLNLLTYISPKRPFATVSKESFGCRLEPLVP